MFPRWRHHYITKVSGSSPAGATAAEAAETVVPPGGVTQNQTSPVPDYQKLTEYSAQILSLSRNAEVKRCLLRKEEFEPALVPAEE